MRGAGVEASLAQSFTMNLREGVAKKGRDTAAARVKNRLAFGEAAYPGALV